MIDSAFAKLEEALGLNPQARLAGVNGESIPSAFNNMAEEPVKNIKPVVSGGGGKEIKWIDYKIHRAPKKGDWSKIIKSTKGGPAKYLPETDIQAFELNAWEKGISVTNGKTWKVMAFDEVIGASDGLPSKWVRVEETAGYIHGHPITIEEYTALIK